MHKKYNEILVYSYDFKNTYFKIDLSPEIYCNTDSISIDYTIFQMNEKTREYHKEKINSWRITEYFGNWGYEKNSVDFTELYTKHTYRNVESKNRFYQTL